ncbi:DUF4292 domain-containing protein [Winogradskyella sp. A3E31]|uniref:DUF4292 domain-containing protein n=1 Tax=Winogradskyella sp. A3E31 TaxID=3349637 RepID=UPI00398B8E73
MNKPLQYIAICLLIAVIFTSCRSTQRVIEEGKVSTKLSAKDVIREHSKREVDFKTLQGKVKIELTQNQLQQGYTFNIRMEKDKAIWLNAPLGLARLFITPEKVQFYNKTDNTYFDGGYALLSDVAGIDLDFYKVQNILLGQAIYDIKAEPHKVSISENSYALQPNEQDALIELFYLINPSHFKLDSLQLFQQTERRMLQVDYGTYQTLDKEILPENIRIIAVEDSEEVVITMEFKSLSLNEDVRFPFRIPSGYEEIIIK